MTSNIAITEKNKKTICPRTQGTFSDNVSLDIDGFANEPVVQCDVQVVEKTFAVDSK